MLALDLAYALDPVLLARKTGIEPDQWQNDCLRSESPRILMNCTRQSGKSTVAAWIAVHTALYRAPALILLVSRALRQSQEIFRKVLATYRDTGKLTDPEAETALRLELSNGSRIISLPGKEHSIRAFSGVNLLIIDEAARVLDDLYYSVRPMLAVSQGRLIALSTPFGKRGWFYRAWESKEPWERYTVTALECPRISPDFLEEEKETLGEWWYRQEYFCEFMDSETQVFTSEDIEGVLKEEIEAWAL